MSSSLDALPSPAVDDANAEKSNVITSNFDSDDELEVGSIHVSE